MTFDCDVVRDLLPLYVDEACSEKSRDMVETHLQECPACRDILERIRRTEIDEDLQIEKAEVLGDGAKRFKQRSAMIGSVIAGLFMIPILICLLINLVSGRPLGWFLVVLASLAVAASLIIVPLMVPEDKAFWTFAAFCASVVALLGVICMNTRGSWFWIASSATLFGLAVVFLPFIIRTRPARQLIGNSNPVIIVLVLDVVLFLNMMNMIRSHGRITLATLLYTLGILAGIAAVVFEILRKRGTTK